jgi:2-C-methyl-D-erythritol 4-phosphate cytidylyltransferase
MRPGSHVAILLAAGASTRFGGARSKLLEPLGGGRVIDVTLANLRAALPEAELLLVSTPEFRDEAALGIPWIAGGARRQDSARAGIEAAGEAGAAFLHDAARPFPMSTIMQALLAALDDPAVAGAAPGLAVTDTIKRVDARGRVIETLDRGALRALQTPQAVRPAAMRRAVAALDFTRDFTDDLAVLEAAGLATVVVPGDRGNFKITTREDLLAAERMLVS